MRRMKVGVIGCGQISGIYLSNCTETFKDVLEVAACADLVPELARKRAEEFGVPKACTVEELLEDPDIEIVLNLTAPKVHAAINLKALQAGKHVYTEKPFALSRSDADEVLALAKEKGLRVGCAPDTFLGAGVQTVRKIIDDGWIGTPFAAGGMYVMGSPAAGMHPNFQNFLRLGGDPMLDMGPYIITALVALFGPVSRVTGSARQLQKEVTVKNPKSHRYGDVVPIEAPMNVSATLDMANGVVANLQVSKESYGYTPRFEIFGTEGMLIAPDPNFFSGPIILKLANGETKEMPVTYGFAENSRGIGVADMAYGILHNRPHRASGKLARHALDVMLGILESSETERHIRIASPCERPAPLPLGLKYNRLDS